MKNGLVLVVAKRNKKQENLQFLFFVNLTVIVLLLSLFNLYLTKNTQSSKTNTINVLGAETDNTYWENLLLKHPTYIDAWLELDRPDKVLEIDPNYFKR